MSLLNLASAAGSALVSGSTSIDAGRSNTVAWSSIMTATRVIASDQHVGRRRLNHGDDLRARRRDDRRKRRPGRPRGSASAAAPTVGPTIPGPRCPRAAPSLRACGFCARKKPTISADASGPIGSVASPICGASSFWRRCGWRGLRKLFVPAEAGDVRPERPRSLLLLLARPCRASAPYRTRKIVNWQTGRNPQTPSSSRRWTMLSRHLESLSSTAARPLGSAT